MALTSYGNADHSLVVKIQGECNRPLPAPMSITLDQSTSDIHHHFIKDKSENGRVISDFNPLFNLRNTCRQKTAVPNNRSDDQLVPVKARLPYGKINLILDLHKLQKEPYVAISVDIPQKSTFFDSIHCISKCSIYLHTTFLNTLTLDAKSGTQPILLCPPAGEQVIDFVNELGYPECLTGKTSGSDKPKYPILQMPWGIVTRSNVDYAELLWEEFVQGIQTFFSSLGKS
ncbi:hypothetical protein Tco_1031532 [Tanacetum coccineum]|uniref:Uncharacterized protein n=1 Tax=Tanacetum coccineum TaxID=301880 RepID=A0ABQ5G9N2_9ASTR